MKDLSSLPWWERPPFFCDAEQRRYRRRCKNHDYQKPNRRYMITISASPLLPPLSNVFSTPEGVAVAEPNSLGNCFVLALQVWLRQFGKEIELGPFVVMPDHVHFCFSTIAPLKTKFSTMIARLMGLSSIHLRALLRKRPDFYQAFIDNTLRRLRAHSEAEWRAVLEKGEQDIPIEKIKFFSRGFTDSIALADRRWRSQLNYVKDNPRRLLFKRRFPEYFRERWEIVIGELRFVAVGNIMLLKKPQLEAVRYSSKYSREKNEKNRMRWADCIAAGGVLVSPFIHPIEKAAKEKAIAEGGYVIRMCDTGFCERYVPAGQEFDLMAEGRLLLMSEKPYEMGKKDMKKARAMEMNELAELIAELPWDEPGSARLTLLKS